ncbi:MAG: hypothetical protein ACKVOH_01730 [Chlamydiales bacterium]
MATISTRSKCYEVSMEIAKGSGAVLLITVVAITMIAAQAQLAHYTPYTATCGTIGALAFTLFAVAAGVAWRTRKDEPAANAAPRPRAGNYPPLSLVVVGPPRREVVEVPRPNIVALMIEGGFLAVDPLSILRARRRPQPAPVLDAAEDGGGGGGDGNLPPSVAPEPAIAPQPPAQPAGLARADIRPGRPRSASFSSAPVEPMTLPAAVTRSLDDSVMVEPPARPVAGRGMFLRRGDRLPSFLPPTMAAPALPVLPGGPPPPRAPVAAQAAAQAAEPVPLDVEVDDLQNSPILPVPVYPLQPMASGDSASPAQRSGSVRVAQPVQALARGEDDTEEVSRLVPSPVPLAVAPVLTAVARPLPLPPTAAAGDRPEDVPPSVVPLPERDVVAYRAVPAAAVAAEPLAQELEERPIDLTPTERLRLEVLQGRAVHEHTLAQILEGWRPQFVEQKETLVRLLRAITGAYYRIYGLDDESTKPIGDFAQWLDETLFAILNDPTEKLLPIAIENFQNWCDAEGIGPVSREEMPALLDSYLGGELRKLFSRALRAAATLLAEDAIVSSEESKDAHAWDLTPYLRQGFTQIVEEYQAILALCNRPRAHVQNTCRAFSVWLEQKGPCTAVQLQSYVREYCSEQRAPSATQTFLLTVLEHAVAEIVKAEVDVDPPSIKSVQEWNLFPFVEAALRDDVAKQKEEIKIAAVPVEFLQNFGVYLPRIAALFSAWLTRKRPEPCTKQGLSRLITEYEDEACFGAHDALSQIFSFFLWNGCEHLPTTREKRHVKAWKLEAAAKRAWADGLRRGELQEIYVQVVVLIMHHSAQLLPQLLPQLIMRLKGGPFDEVANTLLPDPFDNWIVRKGKSWGTSLLTMELKSGVSAALKNRPFARLIVRKAIDWGVVGQGLSDSDSQKTVKENQKQIAQKEKALAELRSTLPEEVSPPNIAAAKRRLAAMELSHNAALAPLRRQIAVESQAYRVAIAQLDTASAAIDHTQEAEMTQLRARIATMELTHKDTMTQLKAQLTAIQHTQETETTQLKTQIAAAEKICRLEEEIARLKGGIVKAKQDMLAKRNIKIMLDQTGTVDAIKQLAQYALLLPAVNSLRPDRQPYQLVLRCLLDEGGPVERIIVKFEREAVPLSHVCVFLDGVEAAQQEAAAIVKAKTDSVAKTKKEACLIVVAPLKKSEQELRKEVGAVADIVHQAIRRHIANAKAIGKQLHIKLPSGDDLAALIEALDTAEIDETLEAERGRLIDLYALRKDGLALVAFHEQIEQLADPTHAVWSRANPVDTLLASLPDLLSAETAALRAEFDRRKQQLGEALPPPAAQALQEEEERRTELLRAELTRQHAILSAGLAKVKAVQATYALVNPVMVQINDSGTVPASYIPARALGPILAEMARLQEELAEITAYHKTIERLTNIKRTIWKPNHFPLLAALHQFLILNDGLTVDAREATAFLMDCHLLKPGEHITSITGERKDEVIAGVKKLVAEAAGFLEYGAEIEAIHRQAWLAYKNMHPSQVLLWCIEALTDDVISVDRIEIMNCYLREQSYIRAEESIVSLAPRAKPGLLAALQLKALKTVGQESWDRARTSQAMREEVLLTPPHVTLREPMALDALLKRVTAELGSLRENCSSSKLTKAVRALPALWDTVRPIPLGKLC